MKVFVNTNIIISAILFPNGKTAKVCSYLLKNISEDKEFEDIKIENSLIFTQTRHFDLIEEKTKDCLNTENNDKTCYRLNGS